MTEKFNFCYRVFKSYGILIDFEGDIPRSLPHSIEEQEKETFSQWKYRVFGDTSREVLIYLPEVCKGNTRMGNLRVQANDSHIRKLFRLKAQQSAKLVAEAEDEIKESYQSYQAELLESVLDDLGKELQPSVRELINRLISEKQGLIPADELIRKLILDLNTAAKTVRSVAGS